MGGRGVEGAGCKGVSGADFKGCMVVRERGR